MLLHFLPLPNNPSFHFSPTALDFSFLPSFAILIPSLFLSVILLSLFGFLTANIFTFDSYSFFFSPLSFNPSLWKMPRPSVNREGIRKKKMNGLLCHGRQIIWHFIRSKWSYIWPTLHFFFHLIPSNEVLLFTSYLPDFVRVSIKKVWKRKIFNFSERFLDTDTEHSFRPIDTLTI